METRDQIQIFAYQFFLDTTELGILFDRYIV